MAKREVYVTSLNCGACRREGRKSILLRINAWPSNPSRSLLPAEIRARYSVTYCTDCDGDLGALTWQRSS